VTIRDFLIGLAFTSVLTICIVVLFPGAARLLDVSLGILLAVLNAMLAAFINWSTIGLDHRAFMIWNVGGHGCRAGLLLLAIACSSYGGVANVPLFAMVTFAGYFSFLFFEIAALNRHSIRMTSGS